MESLPGPSILVGDFNFCSTWPEENKNIPPSFTDVWAKLRPNENGWTEDTFINIMRYNQKNEHKQVRFDRTLFHSPGNSKWQPNSIDMLGTDPVSGLKDIWPSDHFGLLNTFQTL